MIVPQSEDPRGCQEQIAGPDHLHVSEARRLADAERIVIVAHELRNPIGAIRNAVTIMESAADVPCVMEQARRLIARQVSQLSVLVEGLLDLPEFVQGGLRVRRETIDIVSEAQAAVESCAWAIRAAGHSLRVDMPDSPSYARVDGSRLRQVITNLLDNACKYTKPPGRIRIALQFTDHHAVFTVEDNGAGIAKESLPKVFELFQRSALVPGDPVPGFGIGLALVHEIVRLHGGEVAATSAGPGRGSTFVVRLPVS